MILGLLYVGAGLIIVYLEGRDAGKHKHTRKMVSVPCGHENCTIDHIVPASEIRAHDEAYV